MLLRRSCSWGGYFAKYVVARFWPLVASCPKTGSAALCGLSPIVGIRSVSRVSDDLAGGTYVWLEETDGRWQRETGGVSTSSSGYRAG